MRREALIAALSGWLCWGGVALACSGPGAAEAIARAELLGWVSAGITGILVVLAAVLARRRGLRWGPAAVGLLLVALHPGWWISARSGDCGRSRLVASGLFLLAAVAVVAWAKLRPSSAEGS